MEIIVDAYGPEEQAMGWYYYLENTLRSPFTAVCVADRAISPEYTGGHSLGAGETHTPYGCRNATSGCGLALLDGAR